MQSDNSKQTNEILSSLLDNEADAKTLAEALESDECTATWHRYQVVRSILSKEHSALCDFAFTQRVAAHIETLPAHQGKPEKSAKIIEFKRRWRRSAGGLAVAASIAAAMVFSIQTSQVAHIQDNNPSMAGNVTQQASADSALAVAEQAELEAIQRLLWLRSQQALQRGDNSLIPQSEMVSGEQTRSYLISNEQWKEIERKLRERQALKEKSENDPN